MAKKAREGINASSVNPQLDGRDRYILDGVMGYMFLLVDACSSASLWFYRGEYLDLL